MRACLATLIVLACHSSECGAVESMTPCYLPVEPYPYKLEKSDPLYDTARDDHQRYLEELESYVNCLDWEPIDHDELISRSGLTARALSSILLSLEIKGMVRTTDGSRYVRSE